MIKVSVWLPVGGFYNPLLEANLCEQVKVTLTAAANDVFSTQHANRMTRSSQRALEDVSASFPGSYNKSYLRATVSCQLSSERVKLGECFSGRDLFGGAVLQVLG